MPETTVDRSFLAKQVQTLIEENRHLRKDVAELRQLTLQSFEFTRRVERRQAELRDDLEITIKMEFGGGFANFQTAVEASLGRIEGKI
ncbi:hypothetical protein [Jiella mangrovi]|uniref:Leucine zipper homeobox-associated domain-containing protein n=1 Tax=Jiella mangrovi TaxID=2821407 RepID=A0ABS4BI89_9HYPH|nr:hypothetical protein [Jiella mangrovi]MBP0615891.1 hypothetical protein [Jiella mangrovi]